MIDDCRLMIDKLLQSTIDNQQSTIFLSVSTRTFGIGVETDKTILARTIKMSMVNPYKQYRQTQIGTADRTKLVILVYDGAITYLKRAQKELSEKNFEEKCDFIFKAQDILLELMGALDINIGEVAQSLYNLYYYMMKRLTEANIKNDPEMIGEVITLLSGLRQTWAETILMMNEEHPSRRILSDNARMSYPAV